MSKFSKKVTMTCGTCGWTVRPTLSPSCTPLMHCSRCEETGATGTLNFVDGWSPTAEEKAAHEAELADAAAAHVAHQAERAAAGLEPEAGL